MLCAGCVLAGATAFLLLSSIELAVNACGATLFTAVCLRVIVSIGEFIAVCAELTEVLGEIKAGIRPGFCRAARLVWG